MRLKYLLLALVLCASAKVRAAETVLKVGHVGHDHHLALFVAAEKGKDLAPLSGGAWLQKLKDGAVYRLIDNDKALGQVQLLKVGGGSGMPAALSRNEIEVGLGGVAATVAAIDKGADMKIIAPCNCDGDMLMVKPDFPAIDWASFVKYVKASDKPVRIGYKAPRAVAYLILMRALKAEGVSYGAKAVDEGGRRVQVVLVNLQKGANMVPSLAGGMVDGFVMNQPVVAVAEAKKVGRVIADLRDLPPMGKWFNHPCCCVVAAGKALQNKRRMVSALMRCIVAGGRFIGNDVEASIAIASKWTRKSKSVESKSVPTVVYATEFDTRWEKGINTWFAMMNDLGQFTGKLKGMQPEAMNKLVSDDSLINEAVAKMPKAKD